jgi:hypothetical protein
MINGDNNIIRPDGGRTDGLEQSPVKRGRRCGPKDAVEITAGSGAGERVTGRRGCGIAKNEMSETITQVRIRLHERITSGFYDSEEVLDGVAGKILDLLGL